MADKLILREDGSVEIGWGDISCTLRVPTIGEILSFVEESERADAWANGTADQGDESEEPPKAKTLHDALSGGPYLALYQRMLAELGDAKVETTDLPPWLATGDTIRRIRDWWVTSPLSRAEQVAVTRTLSR